MQKEKPTRIFISYRRDDADAEAENIYHHLKNAFGDVVFKDNMRIGPGDKWKEVILADLEACTVVLAVIGSNWFIQDDYGCRRLDSDEDWVRKELEYSIQHQKRLIPIVLNGVLCPNEKSFPNLPSLKAEFPSSQAVFVNERELKQSLHKLIYSDLPNAGISLLKEEGTVTTEIDVLADYPLPKQARPDKRNLPPPYVGIRPFRQTESFLFFGRDQDILKLIKKIESSSSNKRIILYHGRSGVGKSSLLTAGLYLRMKQKGWETPKPRRRDRNKGLAVELLDLMQNTDHALPRLFVLDQVEEIFSNPQTDSQKEVADFQDSLLQFVEQCEKDTLLLSFRSDYFTLIRETLDKKNIPYDELELFPLDKQGVLKAITSVVDKQELRALYQLSFSPTNLPEEICQDVLRDKNSSHITTLLQYQLEKLFQKAAPNWSSETEKPAVVITDTDYSEDFRKNHLDSLIDAEFELLCLAWQPEHERGLTLDVLHQYITEQATAGSRLDAEIMEAYQHIPNFSAFFDYLKNRLKLLIGIPDEHGSQAAARLSHDSLAPLLIARFRNSTAVGQRAWQLLEPKLRDLKNGIQPTLISGEDLAIVQDGRDGMRALPELKAFIDESTRKQIEQEAERLQNNETIFNSFAQKGGADLIYSLDHAKALENIKAAMKMEHPSKKEKLFPLLQELLYFFAEGNRRPELARQATEMLHQLKPEEPLKTQLKHCTEQTWTTRSQFEPLLQALPLFSTLQARYYPVMVDIPGGKFDMGSDENEAGHQSDQTLHPVKLSSFRMAATPVTFYQYALYCEANAESLQNRTPSWGRFGDHPLVNISWYDAIEYCNWLSARQGINPPVYDMTKVKGSDENNKVPNDYLQWKVTTNLKSAGFRLPTEAEWEFAARCGSANSRNLFAGSDYIDEVGWYWQNSGDKPLEGDWDLQRINNNNGRTHPVKGKKDNGTGLYDMSGNVFEWCWDWYAERYYEKCFREGLTDNPRGPEGSSTGRVLRGGSWNDDGDYCRVANRYRDYPSYRGYDVCFRPAQDLITL